MAPEFYLYFVGILLALALADLVVGVANDAVNFLNSAIGSQVASRRVIMMVASCGIILGATFSSGMMEVARKGIFNPEYFRFAEVMIIFLAVMLTDVLLLDVFNTFGLPTSTTVSMVFELLGASVAIAFINLWSNGAAWSTLGLYINSSSTLAIVSTIFFSVSISFVLGALMQWLSRFVFSFQYDKRLPWFGGIWSGLAMALITYFLLLKGIKGASFVSQDFIRWVEDHTGVLLLVSFVVLSVLMQLLLVIWKINVLRLVVLFGTFSLAMAFAGNDLVNFLGVPLAGLESFRIWSASGVPSDALLMGDLAKPVNTETYLLVFSGIIMIMTLWWSKKARTVTDTEVSLGRQEDGAERFSSNSLARHLVWYSRRLAAGLARIIPTGWANHAETSFQPVSLQVSGQPGPAFDLVRASVNLTVASTLIAFATSLKLPLSTTYVTFMVAMGTSLSDRAWGRGSAVYRVAGVLNVIGGWFLTAIVAFTVSGLFAVLIYFTGVWGVGLLVFFSVYLLSRTFIIHRRKENTQAAARAFEANDEALSLQHVVDETARYLAQLLRQLSAMYGHAVSGVLHENRQTLQVARRDLTAVKQASREIKRRLFRSIKRLQGETGEASRTYLQVYDFEQDLLQSIQLIVETSEEYVLNSMPALSEAQQQLLQQPVVEFREFLENAVQILEKRAFGQLEPFTARKKALYCQLETALEEHVAGIQDNRYGMRNSMLLFALGMETKDIISITGRLIKLYSRVDGLSGREFAEPG